MIPCDYRIPRPSEREDPPTDEVEGIGLIDEDVEIPSRSPASSVSHRRERRTKTEFVVSRLGSTAKKSQRKEAKRKKRKHHVGGSKDELDLTTTVPQPLLEEAKGQDRQDESTALIARNITEGVGAAAHWIRRPVILTVLAAVIASFLFSRISPQIVPTIRQVCSLPVIPPAIPFCNLGVFKRRIPSSSGQLVLRADYPRLVALQTKTFDKLLDESMENKGLALEVKKAEMASNDLITLVSVSDLRGKDQIAERLGQFVEDARGAGRSLNSLGAKIQGAVDSIATLNDYALETIEAASTPPSFLARVVPFPIYIHSPTKKAVVQTFLLSMDAIGGHMFRLREEAEGSMVHLIRLEEHLSILHKLVHQENTELTAAQEDILAELWTWLGGNRRKLKKIDLNFDLLKNVNKYRQQALAHVIATLQTLHTLDADMEELRARVAAPEVIGDQIPTEVHVKSIKAGIERLRQGQIKANARRHERIAKVLEIEK